MNTKFDAGAGPVEKTAAPTRHRVLQPAEPPPAETVKSAEPTAQEEPRPEWPLKIPLRKAIVIKDTTGDVREEIAELVFREPTAQDIIACGMPVVANYTQETITAQFDAGKMALMIARLSKVAPVYISAMDTRDFVNCATMLQQNFMPDWGKLL
jgi:hypothetical protein